LASLRERRDLAAPNALSNVARVATLQERHRLRPPVLERIDSLVQKWRERVSSLRRQIGIVAGGKVTTRD